MVVLKGEIRRWGVIGDVSRMINGGRGRIKRGIRLSNEQKMSNTLTDNRKNES